MCSGSEQIVSITFLSNNLKSPTFAGILRPVIEATNFVYAVDVNFLKKVSPSLTVLLPCTTSYPSFHFAIISNIASGLSCKSTSISITASPFDSVNPLSRAACCPKFLEKSITLIFLSFFAKSTRML